MRKFGTVLAALALVALSIPAFAVVPAGSDEPFTGVPGGGGGTRSNDCPGTVIWDTGMFDEFTPPTGCSSAASAGCFVSALNDGGFPADGRRLADDWIANDASPVTNIKIWARYSVQGYDYHLASNGLHGFCVKFYEMLDVGVCPDGTVPGETAIGPIVYDQYTSNFVEFEITTGVPRNFNYCLTLPTPFNPLAGHVYWVSVSADFDFTTYADGVTQWFWRLYPGLGYNPYCEASWWDTWNVPETNWNAVSVAINLPCWAGWDASFVLTSNAVPPVLGACCAPDGTCTVTEEAGCPAPGIWQGPGTTCQPNPCNPPNPTQKTTWGNIKNNFK